MTQFYNDSIFWVELDKIRPNPYQPRREFDQIALNSLADSIRQYGVLQALVVTRKEEPKEDGGLAVYYELIAGERRLRASKIAGLSQVPVLIKTGEESDLMKLELAIIENVQREDLNPVDRAKAFQRLIDEFGFTHSVVGKKVGKSREYVSNTLRILQLPENIQNALGEEKITEGHTRPLGMLSDKPQEQETLLKEIIYKKLSVREAEKIARKIAQDKVRRKEYKVDPQIADLEMKLSESLGTRVSISRRENGGQLQIDFFSSDDLQEILKLVESNKKRKPTEMMDKWSEQNDQVQTERPVEYTQNEDLGGANQENGDDSFRMEEELSPEDTTGLEASLGKEIDQQKFEDHEYEKPEDEKEVREPENVSGGDDEDLYSIKNFSV